MRIDTQDSRGDDESTGTGFFVDANGTLVTNRHVLKDKAKAYAVTEDGKKYEITSVIEDDRGADLVVCKIACENPGRREFPYLQIAEEGAQPGQRIFVLGHPQGFQYSVSEGVVANTRQLRDGISALQITALIDHGSSGSPVLNMDGQVVGVATYGYKGKGHAMTLGFALSAETVINRLHFAILNGKGLGLAQWNKEHAWDMENGNPFRDNGFELALNLYQDLVALHPDNSNYRTKLARLLEFDGRHLSALNEYLTILEKDRRNAHAAQEAGNILFTIGEYERALSMYQLSAKFSRKNASLFAQIGEVYNKQSQHDKAV
ncbi:MAG: trypsin-like peptidase domain-containing protein, partial [Acidobacteria bacterium]|nr:trypsin-like peptidase domain-containing protein [Acidobacteriota bacterium]